MNRFLIAVLFSVGLAQSAEIYLRAVVPGASGDIPGALIKIDSSLLAVDASGNYVLASGGSSTTPPPPVTTPPVTTGITLSPGSDIQQAVNSNPEGTTFRLMAGMYRLQSVRPKNRDVFVGEPGAILSGAALLTSFQKQGAYWFVSGQGQQGQQDGECDSAHPRCRYVEDLFFDDKPLTHVAALSQVTAGKWFFDYAADRIYFADDPTGHRVETSVARAAFSGSATNVTIKGLIVEKYAIAAGMGAIGDQYPGAGWIVDSNEVRWNHGCGIKVLASGQILRNNVHHNGQMGITGEGNDILVDSNEISFNNTAGFNVAWEAGGSKFTETNHLIMRNNKSHDNLGAGLWTDIDNINTLYEGNVVTNNLTAGISHEISYAAIIRNNIVKGNGYNTHSWMWDGQIQVQNSQNVEVYGNTVTVPATGGNGIALSQQERGTGAYGVYRTVNNKIHNNVITYLGNSGQSGGVADYNNAAMFSANTFDANTYHAPNINAWHWAWSDQDLTWSQFRSRGQEPSGTADTAVTQ